MWRLVKCGGGTDESGEADTSAHLHSTPVGDVRLRLGRPPTGTVDPCHGSKVHSGREVAPR